MFRREVLILFFASLMIFVPSVFGAEEDLSIYSDSLSKIRSKQEEYRRKLYELQEQERSLKTQIVYFDNQISLTVARIEETEIKIGGKEKELEQLKDDIEVLKGRIERLGESLVFQTKVFGERVRASYKTSRRSPIEIIFGGRSLSEAISRYKYLKVLEAHDRKLLSQMRMTRESYRKQKDYLEEKKVQVEVLKSQIENEKARLEGQKEELKRQREEREYLLSVTQADEEKYQDLLAKAKAEQKAIEEAIGSLVLIGGEPVKAGDSIAIMGNSGYPICSTGAHLHFEVRKGGAVQDPSSYLSPHEVSYDEQVNGMSFTGSWPWPLSDPIIISQEYGMSFWAKIGFYNGGPHTGVDMYNKDHYLIRAPADGVLYTGSTACGKANLKYVAIDHGDGLFSYYLHIQ